MGGFYHFPLNFVARSCLIVLLPHLVSKQQNDKDSIFSFFLTMGDDSLGSGNVFPSTSKKPFAGLLRERDCFAFLTCISSAELSSVFSF